MESGREGVGPVNSVPQGARLVISPAGFEFDVMNYGLAFDKLPTAYGREVTTTALPVSI